MKEYQVLRANIVFKGGPLKRKPEVFDIGGFSVILKDGREVMFDWIESSTGLDLKADESIFDSDFRDFDIDFFNENNKGISYEEFNPEEIVKGKLEEIYYNCCNNEGESNEENIPLKLCSFTLALYDNTNNQDKWIYYKFPQKTIDDYNKKAK